MNTIKPNLISLFSVKVFKSNIETTDEYLNKSITPKGIEFKLGQNTAFDFNKKNIRVRLMIKLQAMQDESEQLGLTAEFGIEFHIHIKNLQEFITEKNGSKVINKNLGEIIGGIIYSTARGIIFERTSTTCFNGALLPVIDTNLLFRK